MAAGWLLIVATAIGAAAGAALGHFADMRFIGGLAGGALGVVAGFYLVWRVYVIPANEADRQRDYSNVRKIEDDDDDW